MEIFMEDLAYHARLKEDLNEILESQKSRLLTDEILANTILANIREICLSEIISYRSQNEALSKYLEAFSERILTAVSSTKETYKKEKIKIESRVELLEALIAKNDRDREEAEEKINAEKDGAAEREKRDIRKTGERPKTAKEKREESAVFVEEDINAEGEE
jgi:hypothetical protein